MEMVMATVMGPITVTEVLMAIVSVIAVVSDRVAVAMVLGNEDD